MGLFDKVKSILFDEETEPIPKITKDDIDDGDEDDFLGETKEMKKVSHDTLPKREEVKEDIYHSYSRREREEKKEEPKKESKDDVKITKVAGDDEFDMPKLREEAKEEVHKSNFTFPVFDDDDIGVSSTRAEKNNTIKKEPKSSIYDEIRSKSNYSTRKFESIAKKEETKKEDYSRFSSYKKEEEHEEKHFQLSPIISPVYGILNEDYKKEDIVTKKERKTESADKLDFDSVRKKAYGTLEDEIEESMDAPVKSDKSDILDEVPSKDDLTLDDLPEDGLSVSDLLVDKSEEFKGAIDNDKDEDEKLDKLSKKKETKKEDSAKKSKEDEALGEEDLFDVIDSLYAGKGEN